VIVHPSHLVGARAGQCDRCLATIRELSIGLQCPYASPKIGSMAKRGYSREFKPHGETGKRYLLDEIPAGLWAAVRDKCKRDGVSIRAQILKLLKAWIEQDS
jgi:hypothetical protein